MNSIIATIIWKKTADYKGNNHFFAELCEKLDGQAVGVNSITTHKEKIFVDVEASWNVADEDEALEFLKDKIQASGLVCEHSILISLNDTEFCYACQAI